MVTFEQARKLILKNTQTLKNENILVEHSVGKVLTDDIISSIEMPPFNKSAMDGYALKSTDIKTIPAKLKNIGVVQAGKSFNGTIKKNECIKIMTGAPIPLGADTVIMVEKTQASRDCITILESANKGSNICLKAEDIKIGAKLLKKNKVLLTSDIALLSMVGKKYVRVTKKPEVAVLSTGDEIIPAGNKLKQNQIYNSNGPQLISLLRSDGINGKFLGITKDEHAQLIKACKQGLRSDLFLISGGVSMGDYDLVPKILKELGVKEIFHYVLTKPGKPLFFGKKGSTYVFGIPGNPVSNFFIYYAYIRLAIYKMKGMNTIPPQMKEGIINKSFKHKKGRKHFVVVKVTEKNNDYLLEPIKSNGSADNLALSLGNGFMMVDENVEFVEKNSKLKFFTW